MSHSRQPKDRAFLADEPLRNTALDGEPGFSMRVRLTSYRALPLSCIESIELALDGQPVDPDRMSFSLNGSTWPVRDLGAHSSVWWWILDYGDLFIRSDTPLAPGGHEVAATLVTVEPYITAGRFHFFNRSEKRLECL